MGLGFARKLGKNHVFSVKKRFSSKVRHAGGKVMRVASTDIRIGKGKPKDLYAGVLDIGDREF